MIAVALFWPKYHGNVSSVSDLALGLDKERFKVILIYISEHGVNKSYLKERGCEFFCLSEKERSNSFRLSVLSGLVRILREHRVDILHCHRHKATLYGTLAASIAKTPVVLAHVHGLGRTRNLRRKLMNVLLFRKVNRIIPVANSVKEDVMRNNWRLSADKLFVLENSIDYERFANVSVSKAEAKQMLGVPEDAFVYGTVGRLAATKGLSYSIEAFAKVKQQIPSSQLVLAGDGPSKADLQNQAANMPCRDSILFLGHRENIEQLLKGMDVFVLSSVAEGMPRVILEAMAAGVPCVATEVGGIPEIISGGDVGFLVPPGDSNALALTMLEVANMPKDKLAALAERAQNRVRTVYSHSVVREKLKDLYVAEYKASIANQRRC
jgi:glycosyltransferase involved in cell wall biosynthesis